MTSAPALYRGFYRALYGDLYRGRDWIAFVPAVLLLALLLMLSMKKLIDVSRYEEPPMAVMLLEDLPVHTAPQPMPSQPTPPRPALLQPLPPVLQPLERAPADTRPIEAIAPAVPLHPAPPPSAPATVAAAVPANASAPAPAARAEPAVEQSYLAALRAYLDKIKRYPTSREARLQRPTGVVVVSIELQRDGSLLKCDIDKSSDSMILDSAAMSTCRQGTFPPFPPQAFEGSASRRFNANLEYKLDGSG